MRKVSTKKNGKGCAYFSFLNRFCITDRGKKIRLNLNTLLMATNTKFHSTKNTLYVKYMYEKCQS